jgi:hypothetical protein
MKWIDLRNITGEKTSKIKHRLIQIFYKYRNNLILLDFDENLSDYYFVYLVDNIQLINDIILFQFTMHHIPFILLIATRFLT